MVVVVVGVVAAKCFAESNCRTFPKKHGQSLCFLQIGSLSSALSFSSPGCMMVTSLFDSGLYDDLSGNMSVRVGFLRLVCEPFACVLLV